MHAFRINLGIYHFPLYGLYESLEYIGEGKFAQIYYGKCIKDGSTVALCRLNLTGNTFINNHKFEKETDILFTIYNPNVLESFGVVLQLKTFVIKHCDQIVSLGEETARIHSLKKTTSIS